MLAADKLLLQSEVKNRSIALREKELRLFNSNFSAVGTQAAIMAGFTLTSFVEIDLPPNREYAKSLLHFCITTSICVNFLCVAMVTFVTVWGSGKALRGLDGSMDYAVDSMNDERNFIFACFGIGVLATLGCLLASSWVLMETEVSIIASVLICTTMYLVCSEARRIRNAFHLSAQETVNFSELASIYPAVGFSAADAPRTAVTRSSSSSSMQASQPPAIAYSAPKKGRDVVSPVPKGIRDD